MQWFIPFLAITLFTETYCHFLFENKKLTYIAYALYNPFATLFYTYIFIQFAITKSLKKIFGVIIVLYLVFNVLYYIFLTKTIYWTFLIILSGIIITLFACLIIYQYLQVDDIDTIPNYSSKVWVISGLIIFYTGVTIVISLLKYIYENSLTINGEFLYNAIPRYLCIILYGCIAVSFFIWKNSSLK